MQPGCDEVASCATGTGVGVARHGPMQPAIGKKRTNAAVTAAAGRYGGLAAPAEGACGTGMTWLIILLLDGQCFLLGK
jgi:hypothetical protein